MRIPLLPLLLLLSLLSAPLPAPAAVGVEPLSAAALEAYRAGSLEASLEAFCAASLELSRELMARANTAPVSIVALRFVRPAGTGEATLDGPAVATRPGEFHLRVDIAGLDREERRGRFRHHLRHSIRIEGPDGRALLEETPVDRLSDFAPYVTSLHVIDRIPVPTEWPAGKYVAIAAVEDGLCLDPAKSRAEATIAFEVKPASGTDSPK